MDIDSYKLVAIFFEQVWNFIWALDFDDPTDPFMFAFQILAIIISTIKILPHIIRKIFNTM